MISPNTTSRGQRYNYNVRVLSFLAEQKIATAQQIEAYCFLDASHALVWKVLKYLRETKLIESSVFKQEQKRRQLSFSLTSEGLQELKKQGYIDQEDVQINSNTPLHDIILSELRVSFSKLGECELFISENVLRSKILEEELPELSLFRSHRADAAVLMSINNEKIWLALEYERNHKTIARYEAKIKSWYQAENLLGLLLITENESLIQQMSVIEQKILPHLPRKVLYLPIDQVLCSDKEVKFLNCQNKSLTFNVSQSMKIHYPFLDQNFANLRLKL